MMTINRARRHLTIAGFVLLGAGIVWAGNAWAVAGLTDADAASGLREALTRGAAKAVDVLGKRDGFLGNPQVKIPLPEKLQKAEKTVRRFGGAKVADQLVETMNRAAETAVVEAKPILWQSIKQMSLQDGLSILKGPDDAATQYFRRTTSEPLTAKFRPIVEAATAKVGVAKYYDKFAGRAAKFGLVDAKDADLDAYITDKALDGLFLMIADEEKAIRKDPVATGSAVLKKVFGSLFK
jgi:hypothetical protein